VWFLSPYPWPGRLSACAGCWVGGGAGVGVAGATTGWTTGVIGTAAAGGLGAGAGVDGAGGAGVAGVGATTGGFALGGCGTGTRTGFGFAGVFDAGGATTCLGATRAIGIVACDVLATAPRCVVVFSTTFRAVRPACGSAAVATTIWGTALKLPGDAKGSTNGVAVGVRASDQSRADTPAHAATTSTAASRRIPMNRS
jgi:hypothetical protein